MDSLDYWIYGHDHGFKQINIDDCVCVKNAIKGSNLYFHSINF